MFASKYKCDSKHTFKYIGVIFYNYLGQIGNLRYLTVLFMHYYFGTVIYY